MTTVLVCDLGNVMLPLEWQRAVVPLVAACDAGEGFWERSWRVHEESGFGCGRITPEGYHQRLVEELGLRLPFAEFCRVYSDIFNEDAETLALVRQARVRRRCLLTNTNLTHWEWIQEHHPDVLAAFDALFASHECGLEKPDPEIFRLVMRASGEPPEAHLFVDDSAGNVDAARAVGMDAVVFRGAEMLQEEMQQRSLL